MNKNNGFNIESLFNLALKNQRENNLIVAKNLYQKILKYRPKFIDVHKNLGLIFHKLDEIEKAKECYEEAIKINPNLAIAQYNLALIFEQLGENTKAQTCYKKIIENNPNIPDVHNNLGLLLQKLGKKKEANDCYKKAIKINPHYANAHNNIGTLNVELGKYKEAIDNYATALECNDNVKSAKENIIFALTCSESNNNNSIVTAHNNLKKIQKSFQFEDYLEDKILKNFFQRSKEIIDSIKKDIDTINFIETQIYRRNSQNLDCERHHEVFNQFNIIPKFCFSCFKIQIEPQNVKDLIKLFFIFDNLRLPKNNWRKCMIELRPKVKGLYKGFIYCSSYDEATEILSKIEPTLKKSLKYKTSIKRGCTEFYKKFSNYRETNKKKSNFMNYDERWKKIEVKADIVKREKKSIDTLPGYSLSDFLIINHWLNYAKFINDLSYKDIFSLFSKSEYVSQEIFNQIEFRRNQFL